MSAVSRLILSGMFAIATPFMSSVCAQTKKVEAGGTGTKIKQEKPFVSKAGGFEIERHSFKEQVVRPKTENGERLEVHLFQANSADGKFTWIVSYHDLPRTPQGEKEIKSFLDKSIVGAVMSVKGIGTAHKALTLEKFPGRQIEYVAERGGKKIRGASRIYLRGGRVYFVVYSGIEDKYEEAAQDRFLKSLKFIPITRPENKKKKSDEKTKTSSAKPGSAKTGRNK